MRTYCSSIVLATAGATVSALRMDGSYSMTKNTAYPPSPPTTLQARRAAIEAEIEHVKGNVDSLTQCRMMTAEQKEAEYINNQHSLLQLFSALDEIDAEIAAQSNLSVTAPRVLWQDAAAAAGSEKKSL